LRLAEEDGERFDVVLIRCQVSAHRLPQTFVEVNLFGGLNDLARLLEQRIDGVAGFLFGVLVFGHCYSNSRYMSVFCE
jgi:hypothetical protein